MQQCVYYFFLSNPPPHVIFIRRDAETAKVTKAKGEPKQNGKKRQAPKKEKKKQGKLYKSLWRLVMEVTEITCGGW